MIKKDKSGCISRAFLLTISAMLCTFAVGCGSGGSSHEEGRTKAETVAEAENKTTEAENTEPATTTANTEAGTTTAEDTEADTTTAAGHENGKPQLPDNGSGRVTMAFTGDVFFSDLLYGYYQKSGISGFLSDRVRENLYNSDLYIADHEFVCSDRGEMVDYQLYQFRAPSDREVIFKEMGADVVTLANNHTLDYGVIALQDTFSLLDGLGIKHVGAGNNLQEALAPAVMEVNGKKIAVFGASRFVPIVDWYATDTRPGLLTTYESTDRFGILCDAIQKAKQTCDYVVVFVHFGVEKQNTVEEFQKTVAHGYVDSGADLVVACHPHVLQGIEIYKGKPIAYSLGNFLFSNYHSDTVVLNVTVNEDNTSSVSLLPCSSKLYKTVDVTGDEAKKLLEYIESISMNVDIDENGNVTQR